jgi:hypothetical protein
MKRLLASLAAIVLLATATAAAQTKPRFSLGVRGGANFARTTVDPAGNQTSFASSVATTKSGIAAWQMGVVLNASFGKLALQPALLFSQKGEQLHYEWYQGGFAGSYGYEVASTSRTNWIELPLNVVYTLHGDHGLQVLAGPYLALGVGGRAKSSTSYTGTSPFYDPVGPGSYNEAIRYGSDTYNRRLDVGLNFGLGYRLGPVQVQANYGLGLRNLHASDPYRFPVYQTDAAYNRVAQLTGTYFFNL